MRIIEIVLGQGENGIKKNKRHLIQFYLNAFENMNKRNNFVGYNIYYIKNQVQPRQKL